MDPLYKRGVVYEWWALPKGGFVPAKENRLGGLGVRPGGDRGSPLASFGPRRWERQPQLKVMRAEELSQQGRAHGVNSVSQAQPWGTRSNPIV